MSEAAAAAHAKFQEQIGQESEPSDWFEISQERINQFADVTEDHQFIHIDPEAAKNTPFGGTIAHGFLTLSLLPHLSSSIKQDPETFKGVVMGVNYGFDKLRFIAPVPSGSKVRATSVLKDAALKGNAIDVTRTYTVEVEGSEKPAIVADWITRLVYG
ncbi:MAG TPA: MaoC family dehydratase [Acidimicrobiales bacterium]|nr:MaoC family dehydratase [Acidimicrobiales bacterium]